MSEIPTNSIGELCGGLGQRLRAVAWPVGVEVVALALAIEPGVAAAVSGGNGVGGVCGGGGGAGVLTVRQRLFVGKYLQCLDLAEAAEAAGLSGGMTGGVNAMKSPGVRAAVEAGLAERAMQPRQVVAKIEKMAEGMSGTMEVNSSGIPSINFQKLVARGNESNVRKVSVSAEGVTNVEFYDAQNSLNTLAKIHGLLSDKLQINGPENGPIEVQNVRNSMENLMQNPDALQSMLQLALQLGNAKESLLVEGVESVKAQL